MWICAGGESYAVRWGLCTFWTKILIQNQDEAWVKKNDARVTSDFIWPAIFAVGIKSELYDYFHGKDKNPAILLTLLVLDLLLRKLYTMGGVVIHDSQRR